MKFSLQATIWAGAIFAIACLAVAVTGFSSLHELADPAQEADARGYACFWLFLAAICGGLSALAWWLVRGMREES